MRTLLEIKTRQYNEFIYDIHEALSSDRTETAWKLHNELCDQWFFVENDNEVHNALRKAIAKAGNIIHNHQHPNSPMCLKCGASMEGELIRPDDEDEYTLWSCPECRDFEDF